MTLLFETESTRSGTIFTRTVGVVILRMTGLGLLILGAVAIAVGVSTLAEHAVTDAAGTLAVSALLPFLG